MNSITKVVITVIILIILTAGFYYVTKTISAVTGKSILGFVIKDDENTSEGQLDGFAKCLSEKEAILFINEGCPYCAKQKEIFGNSVQYLDIVKCEEYGGTCSENKIDRVPTWLINGEKYVGVQTLESLFEISGCVL